MTERFAYLMIASSAVLWGIIGIFVKGLYGFGLDSLEISLLRSLSACILLITYLYFKNKSFLKIKFSDIYYFIGTGILSMLFFNWCYFMAMKEISVSVAVILLYTAPAFVMILSRIFFKESLTAKKIFSLLLTIVGCIFVTGCFTNTPQSISKIGILMGIGSGLGYALYSIFGKAALKKYDPMTVTVYTFICATIGLIPLSSLSKIGKAMVFPKFWMYVLALGLFSTVLAFLLYTKGLCYVESGRASIIATIEPVVGTLVGVLFFGEILKLDQVAGVIFILLAVILVQKK